MSGIIACHRTSTHLMRPSSVTRKGRADLLGYRCERTFWHSTANEEVRAARAGNRVDLGRKRPGGDVPQHRITIRPPILELLSRDYDGFNRLVRKVQGFYNETRTEMGFAG